MTQPKDLVLDFAIDLANLIAQHVENGLSPVSSAAAVALVCNRIYPYRLRARIAEKLLAELHGETVLIHPEPKARQ